MADILTALSMIFVPLNILGLVFGVAVGIAFGCMPGLSVNMGLALLFPLAFSFQGIGGILMLLGIYCGAIYGGSISAILLKTPGTPASALLIPATMKLMDFHDKKIIAMTTVGTIAFIYIIFGLLLHTQMPQSMFLE